MNETTKHTRYEVLDGMRGVAALCVMVYHFRQSPILENAFMAVDVFFILSGFVIAHSYSEKSLLGKITFSGFMSRRLIRLYPMFLVGLGMGTLLAYIKDSHSIEYLKTSILCNLFFLPYLGNRAYYLFPLDASAWSLFFELFANLFCLALFRLGNGMLKGLVILCYMLMITGGLFHGFTDHFTSINTDLGMGIPTFWYGFPRVFYGIVFGILLQRFVEKEAWLMTKFSWLKCIKHPYILYAALVALFCFPSRLDGIYALLVTGFVTPVVIFLGAETGCTNAFNLNLLRFLGWISYPVYCLHGPTEEVMQLLFKKFNYSQKELVTASILVTIVLSILLTRFYEEPVRRYLTQRIR